MDKSQIRKNVIEALANVYIFIEDTDEDTYLDAYIEDSIQFMSFVVQLEEIFAIEFPAQIAFLDNFKTLNTICILIEELLTPQD